MKKNLHNIQNSSRRGFLKKSLYTAPSIVALGTLMKPENLQAGGSNPPGPPGGWPTAPGLGNNGNGGLAGNGLGP